ncbi:hypothetical protein J6590_022889 [Homalodisca vitripennis]|nr:hypothetical protein J6590_022889 [Homalodisca vitripennis]
MDFLSVRLQQDITDNSCRMNGVLKTGLGKNNGTKRVQEIDLLTFSVDHKRFIESEIQLNKDSDPAWPEGGGAEMGNNCDKRDTDLVFVSYCGYRIERSANLFRKTSSATVDRLPDALDWTPKEIFFKTYKSLKLFHCLLPNWNSTFLLKKAEFLSRETEGRRDPVTSKIQVTNPADYLMCDNDRLCRRIPLSSSSVPRRYP